MSVSGVGLLGSDGDDDDDDDDGDGVVVSSSFSIVIQPLALERT